MNHQEEYIQYTVENFVHLILNENIEKKELYAKVQKIEASEELTSKALQRVDFAYKRIEECG